MNENDLRNAVRAGLRKARVEGGAPVPVIREYDLTHVTHMVMQEIVPLLAASAIDADRLARQREWSTQNFGPGRRTEGVLDHIAKEMDEVRADPTDLEEWIDIAILALDGAWRAGHEPQEVIDTLIAKQEKNFTRSYPDWRTMPEGQAIEHIREEA